MKKISTIFVLFVLTGGLLFISCSRKKKNQQKDLTKTENHSHRKMMQNMQLADDKRISLNLSPKKAQHQLMNMRSHLQAVQKIINYLSKDEFDSASAIASSKLGLTDEMKMMCSSFGNEQFEKLGLEFHKSADNMSVIIKTKDKNKALESLSATLNYCVACHATFKQ